MARTFTIIAIGTLKNDPYMDIIDDYIKRMNASLTIIEIPNSDMRRENLAIRKELARHKNMFWTALDSTGVVKTSEKFASKLEPHNHCGFVIGGADGLDKETLGLCQNKLAFGTMIWPHKLARLMLVEQLYRVEAIWNNHPYHRASHHD